LQGQTELGFPAPSEWNGKSTLSVSAGGKSLELTFLAVGAERDWTAAGSARTPTGPKR
jgi:aconitate hydratase